MVLYPKILQLYVPRPASEPGAVHDPHGSGGIGQHGTVERSTSVVHRLTGWAVEHDIELLGLSVTRASLEDVYLELTASTSSDTDGRGKELDA